jgi:uncharacterized DUF497 family protein
MYNVYVTNIRHIEKIYFEWDNDNIGHIKRHDVQPYEIEEAYLEDEKKMMFFDQLHSNEDEQRFIVLAITKSTNKFLKFVICFYGNKIRVITAHKATNDKKLLKLYKQR